MAAMFYMIDPDGKVTKMHREITSHFEWWYWHRVGSEATYCGRPVRVRRVTEHTVWVEWAV